MSEAVIAPQWWQKLCVRKQRKIGGWMKKWIGERCVVPLDFLSQPSTPVVVSALSNKKFSGAVLCGGGSRGRQVYSLEGNP